ncbi:MAG: peptide-methionine (R)-S-oxide reductase MsrB [Candidatus Paceibacterota bacterium]
MSKKQNDLKSKLTPEEYHTTQEGGTDAPFTGTFVHNHEDGTYSCVVCNNLLFNSETKFDSGSGWPSFYDLAHSQAIEIKKDTSHNMNRDEVVCAKCGSHLGHLFSDGPRDKTGLRYCINSSGLRFEGKKINP